MLDTAIIGGGVCGLALARSLSGVQADYLLFEARERLGGRVLSLPVARTRVDLGPTWFWPDTQPLVARLVEELGLTHFAQLDQGQTLVLSDPNEKPERRAGDKTLHAGARRLVGGMASLVEALAEGVAPERVRLGHVLEAVVLDGDKVVLRFSHGAGTVSISARRVVLALPPRLLAEQVRFEPALPDVLQQALLETPTWMADQAKAVVSCARPSWREQGLSGDAFVTHGQAVFGQVFDASEPQGLSALGAFVALAPGQRAQFALGLPMLMESQLNLLFGEQLVREQKHYHDWALERFTCSARDREEGSVHVDSGHPALRQPHARGQVFFAGAETGSYAAGYLEGALDAARRIKRELAFIAALESAGDAQPASELAQRTNAESVSRFKSWSHRLSERALLTYLEHVSRALARQEADQLTQRAMLAAVEEMYRRALDELERLPFEARAVKLEQGRCALLDEVLAGFGDFHAELLEAVVRHNRSSCALRNFADEHAPARDYIRAIQADVGAAWREFCLAANAVLAAKRL